MERAGRQPSLVPRRHRSGDRLSRVVLHSAGSARCPMHRNGIPAERTAARIVRASGPAGMAITAVVLAATLTACGTRPAHGNRGAPHHGPEHAVLATPAGAVSRHQPRHPPAAFRTTRTFHLGAGRATRTFTFRERSGVIL